mmetsp:Transcript_56476/g.93779  ORF Transcript_56476/g.93779 Transcript_56476/m.93779 type:complete len:269 (-) Transcript_56476:131-937(-)
MGKNEIYWRTNFFRAFLVQLVGPPDPAPSPTPTTAPTRTGLVALCAAQAFSGQHCSLGGCAVRFFWASGFVLVPLLRGVGRFHCTSATCNPDVRSCPQCFPQRQYTSSPQRFSPQPAWEGVGGRVRGPMVRMPRQCYASGTNSPGPPAVTTPSRSHHRRLDANSDEAGQHRDLTRCFHANPRLVPVCVRWPAKWHGSGPCGLEGPSGHREQEASASSPVQYSPETSWFRVGAAASTAGGLAPGCLQQRVRRCAQRCGNPHRLSLCTLK